LLEPRSSYGIDFVAENVVVLVISTGEAGDEAGYARTDTGGLVWYGAVALRALSAVAAWWISTLSSNLLKRNKWSTVRFLIL